MASIDEIREGRLNKLRLLESRGINAYPTTAKRDKTLAEVVEQFDALSADNAELSLVGRIMAIRGQGKIIFIDIDDGSGKLQALLKQGETKDEDFALFNEAFDIGDFAEVKGTLFISKQGEKTLLVESVRMLAKSLRPLPEKWHGLQDIEERFRKRYLDLLSNAETRERMLVRSRLVTETRKILDEAGYLEVETPALQPIYGGASAEPFVTHHNALDMTLYLRISDELYLKRLLAGGLPKVYEIARDFRNEGIDHTHNPEFTMLEFYEAYSDAEKMRSFVESMMRRLAKVASESGVITFGDAEIDFNKPFAVRKYAEVLAEGTGLKDPLNASKEELLAAAERLGADADRGASEAKLIDNIFKKIRPTLIQPIFLIDYPVSMLPLTKRKEGEREIVDAFQLYAGGIELVKAFSELNDPIDQRSRFEEQAKTGDKDAQVLDEDFIEAMEYGIPPAGGVGIGIDRLTMLLTNTHNIKEVILFPTLKPKN